MAISLVLTPHGPEMSKLSRSPMRKIVMKRQKRKEEKNRGGIQISCRLNKPAEAPELNHDHVRIKKNVAKATLSDLQVYRAEVTLEYKRGKSNCALVYKTCVRRIYCIF